MRLLFWVMVLLLVFGLLGFMFTNLYTHVPVVIWDTLHPDVHIFTIVLSSVLVGVVVIGLFAIAEGAKVRLENRRLRNQIRKLENELNYARTQPSASIPPTSKPEPLPLPLPRESKPGDEGPEPPSAPVYGPDPEPWPTDPDDDAYSGGRAV